MWIERLAKRLFNPLMAGFHHVLGNNVENFSTCHPDDVHRRVRASCADLCDAVADADASRRKRR